MLDRLDRPRGWLVSALALCLCVTSSRPVQGAGPQREFEPVLVEADEHVTAGRYEAALQSYAEAFELMPAEMRVTGVGEFVALAAGRAAVADYELRGERESLETARELILEFISEVEAVGPSGSAVDAKASKQQLSELEELMPEDAPPLADDQHGVQSAREDESVSEAEPLGQATSRAPHRLETGGKAGVALSVVGGLGLIGGLVLLVIDPIPVDDDPLDATKARNTKPLGGGVLGVGAAMLVTGAVLLVMDYKLAKKRRAAVVGSPWFGSGGAGIGVAGRF